MALKANLRAWPDCAARLITGQMARSCALQQKISQQAAGRI